MRRLALLASAAVVAAVPASIGLVGNASFSEDVPVRVPSTATLLDDHGHRVPRAGSTRHAEPGDDHGGATPRAQRTGAGDDRGGPHRGPGRPTASPETGDDHGGAVPRAERTEAGDDHGGGGGGGGGGSDDGGGRHGGSGGGHGGGGE